MNMNLFSMLAIAALTNAMLLSPASRATDAASTSLPVTLSLAGVWNFKLDPQDEGVKAGWLKAPRQDQIRLPGTDYRNSYPIWVYPTQLVPVVPPNVKVARALDESAREELARGGKVLLLPDASVLPRSIAGAFQTDFWCYPMFKKYNPPGTLGILCDPKHPALADFPTEFHSDWQWWRLTKNGRPMILDSLPQGLRPIVQVVDNFERNHKLGLVWEAQVGKGKLLVCSSDLLNQQEHPEVRQFFQSLLRYAASPQFQPSATLDMNDLKKLISPALPAR